MKRLFAILVVVAGVCLFAAAQQSQPKPASSTQAPPAAPTTASMDDDGERAFKANCSRCHTAPEQLSPRIAGTVLRHMRVRATLSAADEKAILRYLAP